MPVTCLEAIHLSAHTLEVCGLLNSDMEAAILSVPFSSYDTVELTSNGGQAVNAVDIMNAWNAHHIRLVIPKYCYSACSNIMIMGADDITINAHAVVSFHHSSSFVYNNYIFNKGTDDFSDLKKQAEAEIIFYKSRKLKTFFLFRIAASINPICVGWDVSRPGNVYMRSQLDEVVPTRAEIEAVRGPIKGYWPESLKEAVSDRFAAGLLFQGRAIRFGLTSREVKFVPSCPK